ncbi:MAG: thioredoxin-dependent thiol peroxidase [Candidatus Paceibacterota bacterium]|jgi:peroxiredoxin Q/BCP
MLKIGQKAPEFSLPDQEGKVHNLSDYKGKRVLLYFYPKDDTPGCVTEACTIRDSYEDFQKMGLVVLGVSVDSVESHKKFEEKYKLPFTLLSDEKKEVVKEYEVLNEVNEIANRISFLIGEDGNILKVYEAVKPALHAGEVLTDAKK